jgi:hypothetical protein
MAIAVPWLPGHSADYRNMRAAFYAGYEAGKAAPHDAR